ncbi:hypothetical protein EDB84DRAFT_1445504 [Lactarius hengduanensis]|nr:hypothetical protein EDB84DRAFT_1445504 [Lactarius hengduanensis]
MVKTKGENKTGPTKTDARRQSRLLVGVPARQSDVSIGNHSGGVRAYFEVGPQPTFWKSAQLNKRERARAGDRGELHALSSFSGPWGGTSLAKEISPPETNGKNRPHFFIKGYKIDLEKLQANFRRSEEDPEYVRFLYLWQKFPAPFLYLATGTEPGQKSNLVVVLADGYDKAKLDKVSVVELSEPYTAVFTKGIWVKDA